MESILYIVAYGSIAIFLIACIVRVRMWAKMPLHVRWELYPVAHEGKKAKYGGSYLEEFEWWTKKREVSLYSELKAMIPEILFLVALKEHNPKLWYRSFPFHFGLYLVIGCAGLMLFAGILGAFLPSAMAGGLGVGLHYIILACGVGGLALALVGALGLLERRLNDPDLKDFTTAADIFNLLFFVVAFGCAFVTFVLVDNDLAIVGTFAANLVTFNLVALPGEGLAAVLPAASIVLVSALIVYIPLTHMSHFVGKYFAYHTIRWNDEPNLPGGDQEPIINELLNRPVTWSAPHINGDGKKTWADVATEDPTK
jgi:nitrate reductase gamma subunit